MPVTIVIAAPQEEDACATKPSTATARVPYPTAGPDREHIVPRDDGSPPYFRERLAVTVKGKAMRTSSSTSPTPGSPTRVGGPDRQVRGLFTTGNLYKGEAAATAQSGRRFVTFMTHRHLPVWVQLLDHRHRNSPTCTPRRTAGKW